MSRRDISKAFGAKLLQIRQTNNISIRQMVEALNCDRVSYARNENGLTIPNIFTLCNLGNQLEISLNWFLLDEGPMHLSEITTVKQVESVSQSLSPDFKELLDYMEKIPLLRHEILVQFHRFREEHPALVETAMRAKDSHG